MEHAASNDDLDADRFDVQALMAQLGITDDVAVDTPPDWVLQPLTAQQRLAFSQLVLHSAAAGLAPPDQQALLLLRLAMQPGLPEQGAGFLAFAAAELMGAFLLDNVRQGRGARDVATVLGLVGQVEDRIAQFASGVQDEDQDQDAGTEMGVGA